ncbi:DUF4012 domain-containing protein, partial [Candidatus Peregrinibacteria bacterium]|nr:DUF4012 domain-containing protein [Candidatus Peregrinibacteria bacterium]
MSKKLRDLKLDPQAAKVDLRNSGDADLPKVKKKLRRGLSIYKHETPINEMKDLQGKHEDHYLYVRGEKHTPPKYLGNLLRIAAGGFLIILLITSFSVYSTGKKLEKEISAQAFDGYNYLLNAGENATKIEFKNAQNSFEQALSNFSEVEKELWFISTDKTLYAQEEGTGHAVNALLNAGKYFAQAGAYFIEALEEFNKIPLYFVAKNSNPDAESPSITDTLKLGLEKTDKSIEKILLASEELKNVNPETLPSEIAARIYLAKQKVEEVARVLAATKEHFPALLELLGDEHPHRYLILLQNNNEIRPSGGFIGSYAIMDINEGYISNLEVHDVYKLDSGYGSIIEPPDQLKQFINNWRLHDSNYSYDFPLSASKAKWFLQKEGGPTVDTVIGINQGLLSSLLDITGPVQVGEFGTLSSENYLLLLSYVIEGKIWGPEDPKHILKVFVPAFKEAIMQEKNIGKVGSTLYKAVQQKHVMLYSSDPEIEAFFEALGLDGSAHVSLEGEDYLSVINYSIGGTKSDQFIEESISHDSLIDKNGQITNTVTVKRSHLWREDIYFQWKDILVKYNLFEMPDQLIDILGRGKNETYMMIYVPAGSMLLETNGADVETRYDADLKKTYFAIRLALNAGESKEIKIKYRLPFKLN